MRGKIEKAREKTFKVICWEELSEALGEEWEIKEGIGVKTFGGMVEKGIHIVRKDINSIWCSNTEEIEDCYVVFYDFDKKTQEQKTEIIYANKPEVLRKLIDNTATFDEAKCIKSEMYDQLNNVISPQIESIKGRIEESNNRYIIYENDNIFFKRWLDNTLSKEELDNLHIATPTPQVKPIHVANSGESKVIQFDDVKMEPIDPKYWEKLGFVHLPPPVKAEIFDLEHSS
ncbi:MAG TPA: hypothetical protein DCP90_08160 [Clostridiales bacterium]|nr:MAG: hypothetical protein A2Y22_01230 [Clostridiales bacterium GWD2_32_59]HAN10565.1 hypothetical protein [Clostridiales bacterium]